MKSGRLRNPDAPALAGDVRTLVDALPFPAMVSSANGALLHANAAMRAAPSGARETTSLVLGGIGECTLSVVQPVDAQTQRLPPLGLMLARGVPQGLDARA